MGQHNSKPDIIRNINALGYVSNANLIDELILGVKDKNTGKSHPRVIGMTDFLDFLQNNLNFGGAVEDLATTLIAGNFTGGTNILVSSGDLIEFEDTGASNLRPYISNDSYEMILSHNSLQSDVLSIGEDGLYYWSGFDLYFELLRYSATSLSYYLSIGNLLSGVAPEIFLSLDSNSSSDYFFSGSFANVFSTGYSSTSYSGFNRDLYSNGKDTSSVIGNGSIFDIKNNKNNISIYSFYNPTLFDGEISNISNDPNLNVERSLLLMSEYSRISLKAKKSSIICSDNVELRKSDSLSVISSNNISIGLDSNYYFANYINYSVVASSNNIDTTHNTETQSEYLSVFSTSGLLKLENADYISIMSSRFDVTKIVRSSSNSSILASLDSYFDNNAIFSSLISSSNSRAESSDFSSVISSYLSYVVDSFSSIIASSDVYISSTSGSINNTIISSNKANLAISNAVNNVAIVAYSPATAKFLNPIYSGTLITGYIYPQAFTTGSYSDELGLDSDGYVTKRRVIWERISDDWIEYGNPLYEIGRVIVKGNNSITNPDVYMLLSASAIGSTKKISFHAGQSDLLSTELYYTDSNNPGKPLPNPTPPTSTQDGGIKLNRDVNDLNLIKGSVHETDSVVDAVDIIIGQDLLEGFAVTVSIDSTYLQIPNIPVYADNAAATAGGLVAGDIYVSDGTGSIPQGTLMRVY
jgi:hypothetical protein